MNTGVRMKSETVEPKDGIEVVDGGDIAAWDSFLAFCRSELPTLLRNGMGLQAKHIYYEGWENDIDVPIVPHWTAFAHNVHMLETVGPVGDIARGEIEWLRTRVHEENPLFGEDVDLRLVEAESLVNVWRRVEDAEGMQDVDWEDDYPENDYPENEPLPFYDPLSWPVTPSDRINAHHHILYNLWLIWSRRGTGTLLSEIAHIWRRPWWNMLLIPFTGQLPATGREAAALPFDQMWRRLWYPCARPAGEQIHRSANEVFSP